MSGKKDPPEIKGGGEAEIWAAAMRDVRPLGGRKKKVAALAKREAGAGVREHIVLPPVTTAEKPGAGLDGRTDERLRKGKMEIDGRIDLHGCTRPQAETMLTRELLRFHAQGKRCILVITGKGRGSGGPDAAEWWEEKPGALKRDLGGWLDKTPLKEIVLRFYPAQKQHGGAGAFYVLLRRQRGQ